MKAVALLAFGLLAAACTSGPVVGLPAEDAGDAGDRSDAGPSDAGAPDAGNKPPVCTSGTYWTDGDEGDERMHPGHACVACHITTGDDGIPDLSIAGTVFPSEREPDDCNGATEGTIEITDADGQVLTLTPNSAGNFLSTTLVKFPIKAKVKKDGRVRSMLTAQFSGDCNSCHTLEGKESATGRIFLP